MHQIAVCAAVIEDENGKVLIAKRPAGSRDAGKWEFPGGKIEFGEHPQNTIIREIQEELTCVVNPEELLWVANGISDDKHTQIILITYLCTILEGTPSPTEHDEIKWVNVLELSPDDFCGADQEIISKLASQN